jgi:DNA-binding response OmpR family regulator
VGRVLIIDDDTAMRGTMRKILERAGHEVRDAADGRKGVALFRAEGADLVVTDLLMPEQEGIETIIELRGVAPGVRILAVSGADALGHDGRLLDAEALGADASLAKPFTVDQLRNAVAALLD